MSVQLYAPAALPRRKELPLIMGYGVGMEAVKKRKISYLYCCTVHFGNNLLHSNECTVIL